jgi:hypothetical protein
MILDGTCSKSPEHETDHKGNENVGEWGHTVSAVIYRS